jgi:hypothetical protein
MQYIESLRRDMFSNIFEQRTTTANKKIEKLSSPIKMQVNN